MSVLTPLRNYLRTVPERALSALTTMRHRIGSSWVYFRQKYDYSKADPEQSSIVVACVRWIQRNVTEAPIVLQQWNRDQQTWESHADMWPGSVLWLLNHPNPAYNGITLLKAIVADRIFEGCGYVLKLRSELTNVVELWWAPACTIKAVGDEEVFIRYYEYTLNGVTSYLRPQDVIRLPDGMDPDDPRKGLAPVKVLLREVFTDDEAADMTATLMKNLGIPGVVIMPKQGSIPPAVGKNIKDNYVDKFTGDRRGEPLVLEGAVEVHEFGFSPQQMNMRDLRGLPEERISAVLGVNAAVVGLGAGLSSTKVGATLKEYREEAFESTIIPLYRELGSELTAQLLDEFLPIAQWRFWYDLSEVRVLQEDENAKSERIIGQVRAGLISVASARRALGYPVLPEHEVYLRPRGLQVVPVGTSVQEQQRESLAMGNPVGRPIGSRTELPLAELADAQIRALLQEGVPA